MFSRFQSIANKIRANARNGALPYDDHEQACKLLFALDRSIWQMKKESIVESSGYETLTTNELYSKLKALEVDAQAQSRMSGPTPKSLALMSGPSSGGAANANPSVGYALSLIAAKEEELEALDDDQLCLLSNKFQRLYSNRMSRRRCDKL